MALKSAMARRVVLGTLMSVALAGVLLGEGWLGSRDYFVLSEKFRGIGFALLVMVMLVKAVAELATMARAKGINPVVLVIIPAVMLLVTGPFWSAEESLGLALAGVVFGSLLAAALVQGAKNGTENTLVNLGASCFSVIYLGFGGYFLVAIRLIGRDGGDLWSQAGTVVMFLACVKSADIGAYFTGRFIGRHKWAPSISPKKTWEGFFGGMALAVIVASLFAGFSDIMYFEKAVVFGIAVAVSGQLGDLLESMLKRDAGSKDSANLVPEFGGVMDMLDSPLVAAPVAYMLFMW